MTKSMIDVGRSHVPTVLEAQWLTDHDAVIRNGQEDLETVVGEFMKLPDDDGFSGGYEILEKDGEEYVLRVWFDEHEVTPWVEGYIVVSEKGEIFVITSIKVPQIFGKTFCITGALEEGNRADYERKIKDAGGKVGSVTKNLDYLVTNDTDTTSAKMKKTLELNAQGNREIFIINERELIALMNDEVMEEKITQ